MNDAPRFERRDDGAYTVTGDLTFATVDAALAASQEVVGPGEGPLLLDLTAVARTDSAGLALLVEWMRRARAVGREVRYAGMPVQMRDLARISDLDTLLPVAD